MIDRIYYCEGPLDNDDGRCPAHVRTATPPPHLPIGIIETRQRENGEDDIHHFCSWDCAMKYAAAQPVAEVVPWHDDE